LVLAAAESQAATLSISIALDRATLQLHKVYWEKICHPHTGYPLATDGRIIFSRFLSSASGRTVRLASRQAVRAVAAVAAPEDATAWSLSSLNAHEHLTAAQTALASVNLTQLGGPTARTTHAALLASLHAGVDLLYLVAHGGVRRADQLSGEVADGVSVDQSLACLFLEADDGCTHPLAVEQLARDLATVPVLPRLAVLISCQSASPAVATSLATIFGEAGVPAVIAMQGDLTLATAQVFVQALLQALALDESIDAAVAAGRRAALTAQCTDWWMPALFSRLSDGRLWHAEDVQVRNSLERWLQHCAPRLTRADLARLADHLMACPSLRQLPLHDLPDLTALCLELTFWDAQYTHILMALDTLLSELGLLAPVTWHELLTLRTLLTPVHLAESALDYLYGRSRPAATWNPPTGRDASATLRLMIQQLATAPIRMPEVQHPLVDFVRRLMDEFPYHVHSVAADLAHWEQQLTNRLGLQPRPVMAKAPASPALLIKIAFAPGVIDPDLSRPESVDIVLDAWLFPDVERPLATRKQETLATVLVQFTQLVCQARQMMSPTAADLQIEFLLPLELLTYDVDQWPIQTGLRRIREQSVGRVYPIVVRSLDRLENPQQDAQLHPRWQQRWQHLQKLQNHLLNQAFVTVDNLEGYHIDHVERDLRRSEEKVILVLTALTTAELDDLLDMLDLALELGMPAALLTRQCCGDPRQTAAALQAAIAECAAHEIPRMVQSQRQDAHENQEHLGHSLTLLWDDPERLPPLMVYRNDQL
jgi:hypothetical protein